jgi:hypothetical protein
MQFVHHPGDPFAATATATAGTVLQVRLEPAGGYRWTTVTSTDPAIAQVTATGVETSGTATATVTLRAPGTTALTATTSYQPDPHGPPTRLWRLTLTVTP